VTEELSSKTQPTRTFRIFCDDNHPLSVVQTLELSDGGYWIAPALYDDPHGKRRSGFTVLDGDRPAPLPSRDSPPLTTIRPLTNNQVLDYLDSIDDPHHESQSVGRLRRSFKCPHPRCPRKVVVSDPEKLRAVLSPLAEAGEYQISLRGLAMALELLVSLQGNRKGRT
jgi:hypothetical protein